MGVLWDRPGFQLTSLSSSTADAFTFWPRSSWLGLPASGERGMPLYIIVQDDTYGDPNNLKSSSTR